MARSVINSGEIGVMNLTHAIMTRTSDGVFHSVYSDKDGGFFNVYHRSSSDGGATWSAEHTVNATGATCQSPSICVDSGDVLWCVYLVWDGIAGYDCEVRTSMDGGATWGAPTTVWDASALGDTMGYPTCIAADSADRINVTIWRTPGNKLVVHKYYDPGVGWSAEYTPAAPFRHVQCGAIYVDSNDDVWLTARTEFGINAWDIYIWKFDKVGDAWGAGAAVVALPGYNNTFNDIVINSNDEWFVCERVSGSQSYVGNNAGKNVYTTPADGKVRAWCWITLDDNDDVYLFVHNTTDSAIEYVKFDYAGNSWGAPVVLDNYTALDQATFGKLCARWPAGQCVPPAGSEAFAVVYGDLQGGPPNEETVYNGSGWATGGGASKHSALKRPLYPKPLTGKYPLGEEY